MRTSISSIADAKTIGYRKAACAYANYSTLEEWRAFARRLDKAAVAFRKAGISYGYHNHAHEYQPIDGIRPIDVIAECTSPRNVHLEYDLYWLVDAGADPVVEYYRRFGRVQQFHVKDRAEDGGLGRRRHGHHRLADPVPSHLDRTDEAVHRRARRPGRSVEHRQGGIRVPGERAFLIPAVIPPAVSGGRATHGRGTGCAGFRDVRCRAFRAASQPSYARSVRRALTVV